MKTNVLIVLSLLISISHYANERQLFEVRKNVILINNNSDSSNNTTVMIPENVDNKTQTTICMKNQSSAFITTWKTTTNDESITIFTNPYITTGYDYQIDWGDGIIETHLTQNATHHYAKAGIYTVQITGDFPAIYSDLENRENGAKLQTIENWGVITWKSMEQAFAFCVNLTYNATDIPNLDHVTSMNQMFAGTNNFNGDIGSWDVSNVTNMEGVFYLSKKFNKDISNWDVSNVTVMSYMFSLTTSFNQDISRWDVSKVSTMSGMFRSAKAFEGEIGTWDVANVDAMDNMFFDATSFNQDISNWDVSKVTVMTGMFQKATIFNQDLSIWATSQVVNCTGFSIESGLTKSRLPTKGECF